jgi:general secretion pathway protein A
VRVEGYEGFFGLNEPPFSLAPDPRFLFASESHSTALAQVAYALDRREPLVVITGEIGTGKTLLCRTVLQQLRRKTFLSVIGDPLLDRDELLKQLLEDFGVISKDRSRIGAATRHDLFHALEAFLSSLAPIQAHAVVIIDEAQHLQPEVLEEIRLLSNVDDERGTLLQIILVGQTNLDTLLERPELRQLQQRVTRRLRLEPLNRDEVERYVTHRLALARGGETLARGEGAGDLEFTPDAIHAVSQLSGGLPRVINLLCDRALEDAFASRQRTIDGRSIQAAASVLGIGGGAAPAISTAQPVPDVAATRATGAVVVTRPAGEIPATQAIAIAPKLLEEAAPQLDTSFWNATRDQSQTPAKVVQPDDDPGLVDPIVAARPARRTRMAMSLALAGAVAFGAVGIWLAIRAARPPEAAAPAAPAASAPLVLSPRPDSSSPAAAPEQSAPAAAATTGTPSAAPVPAPAPVDPAAAAAGRFDIVVASFRTELRASSVANEVATLGLPIRRRMSDGWHQVISGPFATRLDAEDAQRRLDRAGMTGTQIVPSAR